jgi:hypothetical protein
MNLVFFIILNVIIWAYTLICLSQNKKIETVVRAGNAYVVFGLYVVAGLLAFFKFRDLLSVINAISLLIAGIIFTRVKSGFGKQGIVVLGTFFPYSRMTTLDYDKYNQDIVKFEVNRRTHFVFPDDSNRKQVFKYIDLYRRNK